MKDVLDFLTNLLGYGWLVVGFAGISLFMGCMYAIAELISRKFFHKSILNKP